MRLSLQEILIKNQIIKNTFMKRPNTTGTIFCNSEIAPLKRVIVHRPDEGIWSYLR